MAVEGITSRVPRDFNSGNSPSYNIIPDSKPCQNILRRCGRLFYFTISITASDPSFVPKHQSMLIGLGTREISST